MPDPLFKTVSASNIAALYGKSPYLTGWMLWHNFKERLDVDNEENERMAWGKRLEWPILQATAEELRLEVTPYHIYERRGLIGCTRDAIVMDPQRGLGANEAKNVDYGRWKETWTATTAPAHIEMQLQAQMYVGDGKEPFSWGCISALIGGNDLKIMMREPIPELWQQFEIAAAEFFRTLEADEEPDAFGSPKELPMLDLLYPAVKPDKEIDLRQDPKGEELADIARQWQRAAGLRTFNDKLAKQCKARLEDAAGDAAKMKLPGVSVTINKSPTPATIVTLPHEVTDVLKSLHLDDEDVDFCNAMQAALDFEKVTRKASVKTTISIYEFQAAPDPFGLAKMELFEMAKRAQAPLDHDAPAEFYEVDGHSWTEEGPK